MENYENERTIMNMRTAGGMVSSLLFMDAKIVLVVYQLLKRMQNEGILKGGEVVKFEKFMKATEGKFDIMNIPMELRADMNRELNQLKIRYHVLPSLNEKSGTRQIAVYTADREKFSVWYGNKIMERLEKGGAKSVSALNRLTDRNTTLVSVPVENDIENITKDFQALKINYSQLPDLFVGDGNVQFLVANADLKKLEHWFQLYKEDMLAQGKEIGELKKVTQEQYLNTAELSTEEYINTGDEKIQSMNAKYDKEKGELEQRIDSSYASIRTVDDERYEKFHQNSEYYEITINEETLVNAKQKNWNESNGKEFFASRIPGTWGDKEQTLILPNEQVFKTDEGKTYIGFIKKDEKQIILDANGKIITREARETGEKLYKGHYDTVERKFKQKEKTTLAKTNAVVQNKIPVNPGLRK